MHQLGLLILVGFIVLAYSASVSVQYGAGIGYLDPTMPPITPLGLLTMDLKTGEKQERTNLFTTATGVYADAARGHAWVLEPDGYSPRVIRIYDLSEFFSNSSVAGSSTWNPPLIANITDEKVIAGFKGIAFSFTTLHFTEVGGHWFMLGPNFDNYTIQAWDVTNYNNVTFVTEFPLTPLDLGVFRWLTTDDEDNGKYLYIGLGTPEGPDFKTGVQPLGLNKLDQGQWEVGTVLKNFTGTQNSTRVRTFAFRDGLWLLHYSEGISYYNITDKLNPVLVDHVDNHPAEGSTTLGDTVGCTTDTPYEIYIHYRQNSTYDYFIRATLVAGKIVLENITSITYPSCDSTTYPTPCESGLLTCYGYTDSNNNSKLVVVHGRGFDVWDPDYINNNITKVTTYTTRCTEVEWGTADAINGVFLAVTPNIPACNCPDPGTVPCPALPKVISPSSLASDSRLITGGYIDYFGAYDAPYLESISTPITAQVVIPNVTSTDGHPSLCGTGYNINNLNGAIALAFYPLTSDCEYEEIFTNALNAGAIAVFLVNNLPGPVDNWVVANASTLPVGLISMEAGEALYDAINNLTPPSPSPSPSPVPSPNPVPGTPSPNPVPGVPNPSPNPVPGVPQPSPSHNPSPSPYPSPSSHPSSSTMITTSISVLVIVESVLFFLFNQFF